MKKPLSGITGKSQKKYVVFFSIFILSAKIDGIIYPIASHL
jgi:hypothetical protein